MVTYNFQIPHLSRSFIRASILAGVALFALDQSANATEIDISMQKAANTLKNAETQSKPQMSLGSSADEALGSTGLSGNDPKRSLDTLSSGATAGHKTALALAEPMAAQAESGTTSANNEPPQIQDIVVTARRRDERLQDVPIAVTAVTTQELKQNAVHILDDVARLTAGFQQQPAVYGKNVPSFTIRSQRQQVNTLPQDPSVAVYLADVVQAHTQGVNGALYDLSSVQILKGPQGTLFGRNSTGGAVVITPQAPTDVLGGYISGTYGRFGQIITEAVLNLPVTDKLQLRVSGQINRRDGYVTNLYDGRKLDDEHTDAWRVAVRYIPVENLENKLFISGFKAKENGPGTRLVQAGPPATTLYPGLSAVLDQLNSSGFYTVNVHDFYPGGTNIRTLNISNATSLELGDITLKNIFGYRDVDSASAIDIDGNPFTVLSVRNTFTEAQYSNEFQVQGKALNQNLNYIAGLYFFSENGDTLDDNNSLGSDRTSAAHAKNVSKSVFVQGTYKLPFAESVSLTAGARQTWDNRSIRWYSYVSPSGACRLRLSDDPSNSTAPNPCSIKAAAKFNKLTYTLSADWHVNQRMLVYFAHRLGYRSGGFNNAANTPTQRLSFAPEIVKDYEVGIKTDWRAGDVAGRFNVAAYHQDYSSIQKQQGRLDPITGIFSSYIYNVGKAKVDGVEVEAQVALSKSLDIRAFYSYSLPKITELMQLATVGPFKGTLIDATKLPFAGAPKNSGGGSIRWTLPVDRNWGSMVAATDYYFQSSTYGQDNSFDQSTLGPYLPGKLPGYGLLGARFEWNNIMGRPVNAAFYVKNITAKHYFISGLAAANPATGLGVNTRSLGAPRTWHFEVTYEF
jgi:iron complex outermembrane recepter protein